MKKKFDAWATKNVTHMSKPCHVAFDEREGHYGSNLPTLLWVPTNCIERVVSTILIH